LTVQDGASAEVVVYTQPGCGPCAAVKEFLASHGVDFVERDIRQDPSALADLRRVGALATPTVIVGDQVIVGFDAERLREVLRLDG